MKNTPPQSKAIMERRKLQRRQLIYYLRVFDQDTGELLGHLVDITTEGVMLISEAPLRTNQVFHLKMRLPEQMSGSKEIAFDAVSKWSKKDINPDFYDTGFQFVDIRAEDKEFIEDLIYEFLLPA